MSDLERRIGVAAESIDWPAVDLSAAVMRRLRVEERPQRRLALPPRLVAVSIAIVLVMIGILTPWGRKAVADFLGVAGISINWGERPDVVGADLELGEEIDVVEASNRLEFVLMFPAGFEEPDAIFYRDVPSGGSLHMVWGASGTLPASQDEVAILYSQFRVVGSELYVKTLDDGSRVEEVAVRGMPGFWVGGVPHYLMYRDASGLFHQDEGRLAGNVLAWEEAGVTHRIETMLTLEEALDLAGSLEPVR